MIPWCWNSPFVPLTNRFSASDVSSGERGKKGGTWEPSRQYKVFLLCHAHMQRSWMSENYSFPSLMCFWTLNSSVTIALEKRGQNTLPGFFFFSFLKLLKHFHRTWGKKTSGSVTMSSVREFVSDFQHFSHTWCSLSHVEAQLRTKRWWVSDLKLIPFTHSVIHLICELETTFFILAVREDDFLNLFYTFKKYVLFYIIVISLISFYVFLNQSGQRCLCSWENRQAS